MSQNRLVDYINQMQVAATDACSFVEGFDRKQFLADKRTQQAVVMSLIVIGEAATRVLGRYPGSCDQHADIPWQAMRGMRNRIAHGYFSVDLDIVWTTVQTALPPLLEKLEGATVSARALEATGDRGSPP